jgi:hypothetical protein
VWSRRLLEERVDALAEDRASLVSEIERLAGELNDEERALLGEILLERATQEGVFAEAFDGRVASKGWLRRQWDRAGRPPP